jgi:MerR family Zn(II)-responsive transcriptional regulator of zntA
MGRRSHIQHSTLNIQHSRSLHTCEPSSSTYGRRSNSVNALDPRTGSRVYLVSMTTGEVARACGVSADTIRYYEKQGVIASVRAPNGYRSYPEDVVRRVSVLRRALTIGFSVEDVAGFFRQRNAGNPPCHKVRAAAQAKLQEIDDRIAEMISLRDHLAALLIDWDQKLAGGAPAHLLESL